MELLEDPAFKNKYQKYKLRVKLWESDFMDKYGRRPNKNDIKEADVTIREAYKMYWKLKTRALEETLMDITFTDDVQTNTPLTSSGKPNMEETTQDLNSSNDENKKNAENIDPHVNFQDPISTTAQESECKNIEGAWGDHLSKSKQQSPKKKQALLIGRSSSFQLSQNKFRSTSFTKRNPRKSLSAPKLKIQTSNNLSTASSVSEQTNVENKDGFDTVDDGKPIFGEAVKVTYGDNRSATQSINTVQQLIEGHTVNRKLNPGWLDRCAKQNNVEHPSFDLQRLSGTSDSGIESMESSIRSPMENIPVVEGPKLPPMSDEEDYICNSDSEEERKNKRIRNFKKRLSDQDNHASKRLCLNGPTSSVSSHESSNNTNEQITHSAFNTNAVPDTSKESMDLQGCININDKTDVETSKTVIDTSIPIDKNLTNVDKVLTKRAKTSSTSKKKEKLTETTQTKKIATKRKVRKRIKSDESENSDFDSTDENETRRKKKQPKATKTRVSKKSNNVLKGTNMRGIEKTVTRSKKTQKKEVDLDSNDEEDKEPDEPMGKEPQIYGVETLRTVPRFSMHSNKSGNLIQQFSEIVDQVNGVTASTQAQPTKPKGKLTDKEILEKKIQDGKMNENFVRIDLKKKVFVRGKKNFNFSKYKKNQWKQRKKELASGQGGLDVADFVDKNGGTSACFKCGDVGHFSRYCPNQKGVELIPLEYVDDNSDFPTLEEAQKMAEQEAIVAHANRIDRIPEKASYSSQILNDSDETLPTQEDENADLWEPIDDEELLGGHKIPEDLASKLLPPERGWVEPPYEIGQATPTEVFDALRMFGHESFRPGQEKAVMRILSGQSTLVTLSTGSGKSLCYQLPAYLYSMHSACITLVISPLVSLMDDQVTGIPAFLSAACLHTGQSPTVKENIMKLVKDGQVRVLLVSPEAVVAGEKSTGFGALLRQLPPIAFACIDEAHCISQWSHNFRPSYLMVCHVLRQKLGVKTILALTATATRTTTESIVNLLQVPDGMNGVISDIPMPRNLLLTISKDAHRDEALITLLRSQRFTECDSIIVYCTRRDECTRIAALLRTSLQNVREPEKPNVRISAIAESYHAGLSAHRRKLVQNSFMGGHTRIIVATIAFGMGLNKADIRAVIHYNMPATFEGYVQEVGRAGRDGLLAHCHLFLSPKEDNDKWELQRHIYASGVDRHTIRRLLQRVFVPCSCAKLRGRSNDRRCPGHEVAIPINEAVQTLDITEEMISTLLCYLELHPKKFISVLSSVYTKATVTSYNGAQALKLAAQNSPPLAMAIALDLQKGVSYDTSNIIEFPVVEVASAIGWDSGVVKSHLKNLEWKTVDGRPKRSPISVKYDTLGLRVKAPGDLTENELDEALDALFARTQSQQNSALRQLEIIGSAIHKFGFLTVKECLEVSDEIREKSDGLKTVIREYFQTDISTDPVDLKETLPNEDEVAGDIRSLICSYRDNNFTGRAVARIFHGIQSPNYPAYVWGKCRFWRMHLSCNFNALCRIATREILALR